MIRAAIILLFLLSSAPAMACSCLWAGSFKDVSANTPLIIRGRVKQYGPKLSHGDTLYTNMDVEVLEVVRGTYTAPQLKILGDPGHLCRPYVSQQTFPLQGEFLFAVQTPKNSTVALSGCGEFHVPIQDGVVHGTVIMNGQREAYSVPYLSFRNRLLSPERSSR